MSNMNLVRFCFESLDGEFYKLNNTTDEYLKKDIIDNIKFIQGCMKFRTPPGKLSFSGDDNYFIDQMTQAITIGWNKAYICKTKEEQSILINRITFIHKCLFIIKHPDQDFIHKNLESIDKIYEENKKNSFKHFMPYK